MSSVKNEAASASAPVLENGNVTAPRTQPGVGNVAPGTRPYPVADIPALRGDVINGTIVDLSTGRRIEI